MYKVLRYLLIVFILFGISCFISNQIGYIYFQNVNAMYKKRIIIDPGHGGKDNGACREDVMEDEINLQIASHLYEKCLASDMEAYITRVGDYDLASLYAKNRKQEDLRKRIAMINELNADLFVSIHVNAINITSVYGPMVYYRQGDGESKNLAVHISYFLNKLIDKDKPIHAEDYYLFRNTKKLGVLVECGFISNDRERKQLMNDKYQEKLANYIYEGINSYYLEKY